MHKVRLFLYSIITETLLKKLSEPSGLYKTEHSGYFILLSNFHVWEDGEAKPCVIT